MRQVGMTLLQAVIVNRPNYILKNSSLVILASDWTAACRRHHLVGHV